MQLLCRAFLSRCLPAQCLEGQSLFSQAIGRGWVFHTTGQYLGDRQSFNAPPKQRCLSRWPMLRFSGIDASPCLGSLLRELAPMGGLGSKESPLKNQGFSKGLALLVIPRPQSKGICSKFVEAGIGVPHLKPCRCHNTQEVLQEVQRYIRCCA